MNPRVFVLALSTFAFGSGAFIFAGLLEQVAADLRVATGVAGQLQTTYVLVSALAGPPLVMWLGKGEKKRILLISLALAIALNVACMAAPGYGALMALRAVLGGIAAFAGPAASSAASALVPPERRGSALAIVMGGMTIAFMVGIPMGSVVGAWLGWRATFALAALLAAIAFAAVALFLPRVETPPAPMAVGRFAILAGLPFWATSFLAFGANMTISTYLAPIIRLQTGVVGAGVGAFQLMIGVGSFLGLYLGGRAADRGFGGRTVIASFVTLAVGAGLHELELIGGAPAGPATYAVVALAILTAATALFSILPVVQTRLIAAVPHAAPLALSLNGSASSLGQAFGGAMGGAMLSAFGAPAITTSALVTALCGALFWWAVNARPRTAQAAA